MANHGVSVIIGCYNHEDFVGATIDSALAQDHEPLQVIVIDDGSTDGSATIIRGFGERIETLFQDNAGQTAACRRALDLARHDIVIFLDSDDLLDPETARTVAETWHDGVSKVQYRLRVIDEHGVPDGTVFPKFSDGMTPETVRAEMLQTGSYPDSPTSGNAYARRFLEEAMPLLDKRGSFDGEMNGVAPLYGDVITLNRALGSYRIHGTNVYAQNRLNVERFDAYLEERQSLVDFVRERYRSKGQTIGEDVLDHDLKYQEYALVSEKLGKAKGDPERRFLKVATLALKAAWRSPHSFAQRSARVVWMVALALAPKPIAWFLAEQRFVPGRRSVWVTRLIALISGKRRKAAAGNASETDGRQPLIT